MKRWKHSTLSLAFAALLLIVPITDLIGGDWDVTSWLAGAAAAVIANYAWYTERPRETRSRDD